MRGRDQTSMGGEAETFLTTHWSLIADIKSKDDKDRSLIGLLLDRYWKPVYCYLRRKGYDNEQAKDLTQGFFHEIVLDRNLVKRAGAWLAVSQWTAHVSLAHGWVTCSTSGKASPTMCLGGWTKHCTTWRREYWIYPYGG